MKCIEATLLVLYEERGPLNYYEIKERIIKKGYWSTTARQPEQTVAGMLSRETRESSRSVFRSVGGGEYTLTAAGEAKAAKIAASRGGEAATPQQDPPPRTSTADPTEGSLHLTVANAAEQILESKEGTLPLTVNDNAEQAPVSAEDGLPLTFTNAAEQVLRAFGHRQPMHYKAITERALGMGWLSTSGLTPANSMYAQILTEIAKAQARGERPRFVKHGKGLVGLSEWVRLGIPHQIEAHNRKVRAALHQRLQTLPPAEFEELVGALLSAIGFPEVEVTKRSGDKGIDVRGTLVVADVVHIRMAVQVKRWSNNVQAPVVQQLRGSLGAHEQGLIVTTSDFSKGAQDEASRPDATPVALMNGEDLVSLLFEHEIGVSRTAFDLFELDEEEG